MKLTITDDRAVDSLVWYSMNHRAAIADWAAKQFAAATSDADRISLAIEVFEKFIASVEDLEMLYFALRDRVSNVSVSFLSQYATVFIREEGKTGPQRAQSAAEILRQLGGMDHEQFQAALGLPTAGEYHGIFKQGQGSLSDAEAEYGRVLEAHRLAMMQAVQNRATPELMGAYNKIKHGFVVMRPPNQSGAFMVREVTSASPTSSTIDGTEYAPTADRLAQLVDNTKRVAQLAREILTLQSRRLP